MILKTIHYCWFGGKPHTELTDTCIASWRQNCPDYDIIEWNEKNFDIDCHPFVRQAYQAGKWAFVADYFRAWVLYNHGGIYLDTDVKMVKNFDGFLDNGFFTGFEALDILEADTMGAAAGHPYMKAVLESFEPNFDFATVATMPVRITRVFAEKYKIKRLYNRQYVLPEVTIYPKEWFSPVDYLTGTMHMTKNTHSIHLFNGSWVEHQWAKRRKTLKLTAKRAIKKSMILCFGNHATEKILHGRGVNGK